MLKTAGLNTENVDCIRKSPRTDIAACLDSASNQKLLDTKKCIEKYNSPFEALTACVAKDIDPHVSQIGECLAKHPSDGLRCAGLLPDAGNPVSLVRCLRNTQIGTAALLNCASVAQIDLGPAKECLEKGGTNVADLIKNCVPNAQSGPVSCFANFAANNEDVLTCLANQDPKMRSTMAVIRCISSGNKPSDLIATCTEGIIKDPKVRQALACATQANASVGALAACVSAPVLGGETGRLLTCATQSQSYAGFALCAAGPKMNQEWMIAAQCAASSGGVPATTAACTAGWLTINELSKCFSKGIGGSGCFGENNSIVVAFKTIANDITHGPGPNNEVVKALKNAGIEIKDVSFATPLGGHDAFFPKAGRDFDNARNEFGRWAGDRLGIHF
jgi:hypothetical protein